MEKNSNKISTEKLFPMIRQWAKEKGIYTRGDLKTQMLKLSEEHGELSKAILNNDVPEIIDAIGDMIVVLTNVAELANITYTSDCRNCGGMKQYYDEGDNLRDCKDCDPITIENCLNSAWNVIKDRTGKMKNGTFVKDK